MAQSIETKTATLTGSGSWTVPAGAWKITKMEVYGAGGGGGNATTARSVGAGGGSGAYASTATNISVIPGSEVLDYEVGAAGTGGKRGGTSYVRESVNSADYYVRATGGYAGGTATSSSSGNTETKTANAASNSATADYGTTTTSGNKGSNGSITRTRGSWNWGNWDYDYSYSGTGGAGGNNVNDAGRGVARTTSGGGNPATAIGAGGGGALNLTSSSQSSYVGGTGGAGQVIITYEELTLHVTIDANGGTTSATDFDILYYEQFGNKLPEATLEGYTFLGWFTDGGVKMTADSLCKETADFALKAHWLKAGAIADGSTTASPCQNFTVYNSVSPDAMGDTYTCSWSYTINEGAPIALNVNKEVLTQEDLQLDKMGSYKFTRYVTVLGQIVPSAGIFTIDVFSVNPGEIETDTIITCTTGNFIIGSKVDASTNSNSTITYMWRYSKDGGAETVVDGSDKKELTQADVTLILTESGTYVFKRYATIGCAEPVPAAGEYTLAVTKLPDSYAAPTSNYDEICEGGEVVVTSVIDYNLPGVPSPLNIPTEFKWMLSKDGATPVKAGYNASLTQELDATGDYSIYASVVYFNDNACVVNTTPIQVTVKADPTITAPTLSATEVCPNGTLTLTAADPVGGVGGEYTYNWEFKADGSSTWDTISASQATYSQYKGKSITATNYTSMGQVQYRSYISNVRGCDAHSDAENLTVTVVEVPVTRGDTLVCPVAGDTIAFKATKTNDSYKLYWYENETATTPNTVNDPPLVLMDNEVDTTYYVAQFNQDNGCVSARIPDNIIISYSAHLSYNTGSGDLDQTVCQNNDIINIEFDHGGDCEPQITWDPSMPAGITIDNSVAGVTLITGAPTEAGPFTYHVELHPDGNTKCAAPNTFDGTITVNPVYHVTENKTICGGGYTIGDTWGTTYTFTESGTYTKTLESVSHCDSVVTLNLYIHEWNQFGFEDNEVALATWTNFSSISSPIASDGGINKSSSNITYSGWSGSNTTRGNLESTSTMVTADGNSFGLINGSSSSNLNNGKSITIKTSTKDYGNLKLHFDVGVERQRYLGVWSSNDKAFTRIALTYSTSSESGNLTSKTFVLEESEVTAGKVDIDLSQLSSNNMDNQETASIIITFHDADRSGFIGTSAQYFRIDNICISGNKINQLELTGETEACTNRSLTLVATPPYTNTHVNPPVTTPVVYKWERVVGGVSTVLDEISNVLTDNEVQEGNYKYVVSVGEAPCGQSDTIDVLGIKPAYRLDIVRHGSVCANEVDKVSNINFIDDCQYVDGMFIVTPTADEMRTPGTYTCQLSIPTTENPCDSIITLELEVLKSFDTTVIANICLGETYDQYGFNITPTEEGITYYTSDPSWKCSTGCDSVYRLTLITSSVRQTLTPGFNITLAAWPMDDGLNDFKPACGVRTSGSRFMVKSGANTPEYENKSGHNPSSDYCYAESDKGALRWPNLFSDCSGMSIGGSASYTDYSGAYFEIKLDPHDYNALKLKFDYLRENASTNNAQAFNTVSYSYKFSENGSYTTMGSQSINTNSSWATTTYTLPSNINTLDEEVMFIKVEFTGGNVGSTEDCGWFQGSRYLPSYISVDNLKIWGDRPARASLDGTKQTCDQTYVCEGNEVTFHCQGDNVSPYFKFYVVDETANTDTAFNGATELKLVPTQNTTYYIKAVEQTTLCDSVWGPFDVEVVKNPTITYLSGSDDEGVCGNNVFDIEIAVENATDYEFTWLTSGAVKPDGIVFNDNNDTITIGGTLTNDASTRYYILAQPDNRCSSAQVDTTGTLTVRIQPKIAQTIGVDSACQGDVMQFVVDTAGLNFALVPTDQRFKWFTADATLGTEDTLNYTADEAIHSTRHYIQVKQNGCTTLDSLDIMVLYLENDTLRTQDTTYTFNYGDNYLPADSLSVPVLMHNGEPVPANYIATVEHSGGSKIFPPTMDDLNVVIHWTITDKCGYVHVKDQNVHFELPPCGGDMKVTDKNGNVYNTVRMGLNCWMKENLKATLYEDETAIPYAKGFSADGYTDTTANIAQFGRLYTWYSAVRIPEGAPATELPQTNAYGNVQGVCPDGWRLPDRESFASLREIEMNTMRLPGDDYWIDGGGSNETQFSLVGAGFYNQGTGRCENIRGNAYYWTSDTFDDLKVKSFEAECHCYMWQEIYADKHHAFSVRCIKEKEQGQELLNFNFH